MSQIVYSLQLLLGSEGPEPESLWENYNDFAGTWDEQGSQLTRADVFRGPPPAPPFLGGLTEGSYLTCDGSSLLTNYITILS